MKLSKLALFLILFTNLSALAYTEIDLQLPFKNSFYASSTYATLAPEKNRGKRKAFIMKPERKDLGDPLIKGRHSFEYYFYKNKKGAPLVLLLGGFGSLSSSASLKYTAEKLWQQGYHVATIHSVISWKFVLSASSTGVFGWGPNDARDIYRSLLATLTHIERHTQYDYKNVNLVGLSLGGLSIAHVMNLDHTRQTFRKGIMINPPVDVHYALSVVDGWHAIGDAWPADKRSSVIGHLFGLGTEVAEKLKKDPTFLFRLEQEVKVPISGLKFLIGYQFRDSLGSSIQVGQSIEDNGILHPCVIANFEITYLIQRDQIQKVIIVHIYKSLYSIAVYQLLHQYRISQ